MIQRIQTVFLLLALGIMIIVFVMPYGIVTDENNSEIEISVTGAEYIKDGELTDFSVLPLTIIISIICTISFITIILFKRRMLQIRLSFVNLVLQAGSVGMMYYYIYNADKIFGQDFSVNIILILPVAALILTFIAIRQIAKDEALVKSLDRIR